MTKLLAVDDTRAVVKAIEGSYFVTYFEAGEFNVMGSGNFSPFLVKLKGLLEAFIIAFMSWSAKVRRNSGFGLG